MVKTPQNHISKKGYKPWVHPEQRSWDLRLTLANILSFDPNNSTQALMPISQTGHEGSEGSPDTPKAAQVVGSHLGYETSLSGAIPATLPTLIPSRRKLWILLREQFVSLSCPQASRPR